MPARTRWRASQARVCSGSTAATLVAAGLRKTGAPRRLGADLVAPDDARRPVARIEDEVEDRGGEPDQRLDAAAPGQLIGTAIGHGRAIVDSRSVLVREVMTDAVVTAEPNVAVQAVAQ